MLPESRRSAGPAGASKLTWSLNQPRVRSIVYQALLVAAVGLAAWYFVSNAMENLMARRIASGFGFLSREAGFEIGETTLLSYNAGDTYLRALSVGLLNTFRVATLGDYLLDYIGRIDRFSAVVAQLAAREACRRVHRSDSQCAFGRTTVFLVRGDH